MYVITCSNFNTFLPCDRRLWDIFHQFWSSQLFRLPLRSSSLLYVALGLLRLWQLFHTGHSIFHLWNQTCHLFYHLCSHSFHLCKTLLSRQIGLLSYQFYCPLLSQQLWHSQFFNRFCVHNLYKFILLR